MILSQKISKRRGRIVKTKPKPQDRGARILGFTVMEGTCISSDLHIDNQREAVK